ncbi:secreted protein [Candidatus Magnetobacterium bavaricum]|uniref:Secreted protein n=1 Tax=Candidatus Magnetobacterium bavaricum TaxID=29290 RepID=A0A0F3GSY8_9BACT|nr:secreted protein [Candidatus Magnetobacterium bavaricum]
MMFSKSVTSSMTLLMLVVFLCVSCVSGSVRKDGAAQERFYTGQQAEIVEILRQSRQEMLNNNIDRALTLADEAMEKSKAIKDDVMRFSSGYCNMMILTHADRPRGLIDSVPRELLLSDNFETLSYGYLLVMYDINAFDLRVKDPLYMFSGYSRSGKSLLELGNSGAEELRKAGEVKFADLFETMFKSYNGLSEVSNDKNSDKVNEYKRKIIDSADKIVLLTDDFKLFERDNNGMFLMSRMFALYMKLVTVGFDKDMAGYDKAAKKYAEFSDMIMSTRR